MIRVGVTATRGGLTAAQYQTAFETMRLVTADDPVGELHHGDCIGGDYELHYMAVVELDWPVVVHPPEDPTQRAFSEAHINTVRYTILKPKPYIMRNHDIVDAVDVMIACPGETTQQWRGSGTWATIRYAEASGKPLFVIFPDGTTR